MNKTVDIELQPQGKLQIQTEAVMRSYNALCVNVEISKRRIDNINRAMSILTPEEQAIIHGFYLDTGDKNWADLCEELHIERTTLYRKRQQAIEKLTVALYGFDF